jgi:hypothetical protein
MGSGVRKLIEKLLDKVRELVAPPLVPVPVTPRPRR